MKHIITKPKIHGASRSFRRKNGPPLCLGGVFLLAVFCGTLLCSAAPAPLPALSSGRRALSQNVSTARASGKKSELSGCAMVGNSFVEDLNTLGLLPQMDLYDRIGLTVKTVFTLPSFGGKLPVIRELNKKRYLRIYLFFGENELGWPGTKRFINGYGKMIAAIRAHQPGARLYIQSIFPVSAAASGRNRYGINNRRIRQYNKLLRALAARKKAVYLDVASSMADKKGNLPNEASVDGVHPNKKYCQKWIRYLETHEEQAVDS